MLTSVLRGSLGGNCKSVFIATLNPENDFIDESISTCRFMQRCSEVAVDIAVNSEVDTEKRLEAVEKLNAELEATNFELQARAVQLENDLKAQALHFAKQEEQWERRLTLAQEETQAAIAAAKVLEIGPTKLAEGWTGCSARRSWRDCCSQEICHVRSWINPAV